MSGEISFDDDLDPRWISLSETPRVEPTFSPKTSPILTPPSSFESTLSTSMKERETTAPLSPVLKKPNSNVMYRLLNLHNTAEKHNESSNTLFEKSSQKHTAEMERLSLEREEALRKEAERMRSKETWDVLSQVSDYVYSISAIGLGMSLGGLPGFLIGASGAVGITSRVAKDTGLSQAAFEWYTPSEELQKKYQERFETVAFLLQVGLGTIGGFSAWKAGAFSAARNSSTLNLVEKTCGFMSSASQVMSIAGQVGSAMHNKSVKEHQAEAMKANSSLTLESEEISEEIAAKRRELESSQSLEQALKTAVLSQQIAG